jgi:hypothetical protein
MDDPMNNIKYLFLIVGISITSMAACNYTVGECWPVGQGGGSSEGVTAGGGVIIPTGPSGAGGFGDEPPKQPQDSDSSPKCNEDEEEAVAIVNCSLHVDWPHLSSDEPGTISVKANVQCTAPVAGIEMKVGLARDGLEVASHTVTNSGVASLNGRVATTLPCVSGAYTGGAAALVTFKSPSLATKNILNANSITRPITCP